MALHELRHVEADHGLFAAEEVGRQRFGEFGFAHAGGAGEDEAGDGAVGVLEAHPGSTDGAGHGLHRFVLADEALVEGLLHVQQLGRLALGELLNRHARPGGHDLGDVLLGDHRHPVGIQRRFSRHGRGCEGFRAFAGFWRGLVLLPGLENSADLLAQLHFLVAQLTGFGEVLLADGILFLLLDIAQLLVHFLGCRGQLGIHQPHAAAGLVDQVNGLVGQEAIGDVAVAQGGRGHQGLVGDLEAVVGLIALPETPQDLDGVVHGGFTHHHWLEATL